MEISGPLLTLYISLAIPFTSNMRYVYTVLLTLLVMRSIGNFSVIPSYTIKLTSRYSA
jgi:hypothetical protein